MHSCITGVLTAGCAFFFLPARILKITLARGLTQAFNVDECGCGGSKIVNLYPPLNGILWIRRVATIELQDKIALRTRDSFSLLLSLRKSERSTVVRTHRCVTATSSFCASVRRH